MMIRQTNLHPVQSMPTNGEKIKRIPSMDVRDTSHMVAHIVLNVHLTIQSLSPCPSMSTFKQASDKEVVPEPMDAVDEDAHGFWDADTRVSDFLWHCSACKFHIFSPAIGVWIQLLSRRWRQVYWQSPGAYANLLQLSVITTQRNVTSAQSWEYLALFCRTGTLRTCDSPAIIVME